jgi:type III secretion protein J
MTAAVENPQKLTVVFVPATAYLEQQKLAYFGPFLVPGDDIGFWRASVIFALIALVLMVAGGVFWHRRTQRAAHALPDGPSLDAPVHARNE